MISWLFTSVQKLLQIGIFSLRRFYGCSLLFARVGVNWCRSICTSADSVIAHVFLQFEQKHKEPTSGL